jgi:hypothetical protein
MAASDSLRAYHHPVPADDCPLTSETQGCRQAVLRHSCCCVCTCRHYVALDSLAAAEESGATRRSPKPSRPRTSPAADYDDYDDDVPLGQQHQATCIPAFRPRPAQPTAAEEKFLHPQPLYVPGEPEAAAVTEKHAPTKTRAGRAGVTVPMPPIGVAASSSDFRFVPRACSADRSSLVCCMSSVA